MQKSEFVRFSECISAIAVAFRTEVDEAFFGAYWMALDDLPIEAVESGVRKAMRSCEFMPPAVKIRELSGCDVNGSNRAVLAWGAFERAVVEHGGYRSLRFDDPAVNATVRNLGGWQRCCEMSPEDFDKWLRKDFLRAYEAIEAAGVGPEGNLPLVGIYEQTNAGTGHHHPSQQPLLVETGLPGSSRQLPAPKGGPRQIESIAANIGRMPS